jgi:uncharacterized membrane protein
MQVDRTISHQLQIGSKLSQFIEILGLGHRYLHFVGVKHRGLLPRPTWSSDSLKMSNNWVNSIAFGRAGIQFPLVQAGTSGQRGESMKAVELEAPQ